MVLDDDPRVLESLVPSIVHELARALARSRPVVAELRRDDPSASLSIQVSAHGFDSERLKLYRPRSPHHLHLHLVRETGGRFDIARRLLNDHLFAVVVSDLRFSDDAGGQRAGHLFVEEARRVHPEVQALLYSAYPRPEGFPAERFVRKGGESSGEPGLVPSIVAALERHLAEPAVASFVRALGDNGLVYQSAAFGSTLAQLFTLSRLLGPPATSSPAVPSAPGSSRARRPLATVLLDGESGTGKRGLAAVFHAASERRKFPLIVASCNELTNETLLRSILFGHRRGAFTDAREDRAGLVATAARGALVLDDFHRLPPSCSAILHSFLEDGEYARLGEEEHRRQSECAVVLTVETGPWAERRRSGELPLAFLARVERLPLEIPPLRARPDDIVAQARWLTRVVGSELGATIEIDDDALERLALQPFAESNSRELRNVIERAVFRHYREADVLTWAHIEPFLSDNPTPVSIAKPAAAAPVPASPSTSTPAPTPLNDWQRRLRALASRVLARGLKIDPDVADARVAALFDGPLPRAWGAIEEARSSIDPAIPLPVWEDLWRCFAVSHLGGPSPSEKPLGIPANTLRQWINDRESR
jgi:hypothetical protein